MSDGPLLPPKCALIEFIRYIVALCTERHSVALNLFLVLLKDYVPEPRDDKGLLLLCQKCVKVGFGRAVLAYCC